MRFVLNGKSVDVRAHPMKRLLDVLRDECGLTGTKEGCGEGECGACTVLLDGQAVNACLVPFGQVRGRAVKTIEGLRGRHPLQDAFVIEGGAQCGICTPGMIMAAAALPPDASLEDVRTGLAGNICRCTGYTAIYRAVQRARLRPPTKARRASARQASKLSPASPPPTGPRASARQASKPSPGTKAPRASARQASKLSPASPPPTGPRASARQASKLSPASPLTKGPRASARQASKLSPASPPTTGPRASARQASTGAQKAKDPSPASGRRPRAKGLTTAARKVRA